ncbi:MULTISPECIES: TetR/AcrR family transcriptional regulator [unclassified Sphingomonas]|uniref:TetR/AcrR family transcriptional regulator n=1 Tax=unclassified Sphingomonas TaxID=196159 RepID=UPI0006F61C96|nr:MULTISPECIES: TetR/AcrR family transcriptional regulator [unclassified Sphingomonas]KQX18159.1 TetR family transcriptional regulator [Sphingomonas sp. Root1294]KQY70963.1 TetR family transcriptional regulator [Sphingomonas sp. Root50]KRB92223.1 TetR family transcriptional regulator [Sphingomonas sp. Root720]
MPKEVATAERSATRRKSGRREEILQIARTLFAEKGFEAASIREIGDAAGILSGSLYYHFATKDDMLDELVRPFVLPLLKHYEVIAHSDADAPERLRQMVHFGLQNLVREPDLLKIVANDRKFFAKSERFSYVEEAWQDIFQIWYGVLQDGVRQGKFRSDLNLHITLRMIIELLNGTVDWFRPDGRFTIEQVIETQVELLFGGLTPR